MNREVGSIICRGNKRIGVVHSHPMGSLKLSPQDKITAHEKGLTHVCVTAGGKTKCYRFKPKSQEK